MPTSSTTRSQRNRFRGRDGFVNHNETGDREIELEVEDLKDRIALGHNEITIINAEQRSIGSS